MKTFLLLLNFFICPCFLLAQINVQHYDMHIALSDNTNEIKGISTIDVTAVEPITIIRLNLASAKAGKGMAVEKIRSGDTTFSFTHTGDTLAIMLKNVLVKDSSKRFQIQYSGVPADGLIISKNKWGERTFFGDNWPNRAQQWFPCNDDPDDKASVRFTVTAPSAYQVISNGKCEGKTENNDGNATTTWFEAKPIPTKVMVIGVARFAIKHYADSTVAPVSAWVYPQDSAKGFYDYALAPRILQFFQATIGPYPFSKLANVQSTTIFGGMENAGCIFYDEKSVTGTRRSEALLAHEIAHQWFGNSATEKAFAHLWLSEGFATYFTQLYMEHQYGRDTLEKSMQQMRAEVLRFSKENNKAVVDSTKNLMELLNANSYQKGGWVLHMLRQRTGDSVFLQILKRYYWQYAFRNADTWAFEKVVEDVSGKDYDAFFKQWLFTPGLPQLQVQWRWDNKKFIVEIAQKNKALFVFPLEIAFIVNGKTEIKTFNISKSKEAFDIQLFEKPMQVILDPQTKLLFEGSVMELK